MPDKAQSDDKRPGDGPGAAQDPYPVDPSNELLDGDNVPSKEELAEADVRVSDSGTALIHKAAEAAGDNVYIPPPQSANLERKKALEKHIAAAAESIGESSVEGEASRAKAAAERRAAADEQARQAQTGTADQAEADQKSAEAKEAARKTPPQSRSTGPKSKT